MIDAFVLVFASLLVAGGAIGDRYGRRTALLAGLGIFAAASLWCTLAPSIEWLIAGRFAQALGPALVLPASLAIVTAAYADPAKRATAVGLWGAGSGLGATLGPLITPAANWARPLASRLLGTIVLGGPAPRGVPVPAPVGIPP